MKFLISLSIYALASYAASVHGPLSNDFQSWLKANGYGDDNFERHDYGTQGSFGGKTKTAPASTKTPVIFIHGNSDTALKSSNSATGWDNSVEYFMQHGYTEADLYATSWGDNNALNAQTRTHNCKDVARLRRFIQAVLKYTGSEKVSLITHSMGVTLGRKAIKGGLIKADDGNCDIGSSIGGSIDVYLGLSGANYGLCTCEATGVLAPTCNSQNGLFPGDSCGFNLYTCGMNPLLYPCSSPTYSSFLTTLNGDKNREAAYVYSAWSYADDLILYGDYVWGRPTSLIPLSDGHKVYMTYGHMATKELTADDQFSFVAKKVVPEETHRLDRAKFAKAARP